MNWKLMTRLLLLAGCLSGFTPVAQAFYNPATGRWLHRDPLGEPGHESLKEQSESFAFAGDFGFDDSEGEEREIPESTFMNLYGFVGNNPIYAVDPNGEAVWVVPVVVVGCKVAIKGWKAYKSYKKYLKAMDYTCTGIYAGYKASCAIGCRGTTCEQLTAGVVAMNGCVNGRKLYIQQHCDKYINVGRKGKTNKGWQATEARHKAELESAERGLADCIKRKEKACACQNVPEVCPAQ